MEFELRSNIENEQVLIEPLKERDFETLYAIASDPLLWEQHPNPDRYKREVFAVFFEGAMKSGSAFMVYNKDSGEAIGSSRYYDWDAQTKSIAIGYTFISRSLWGRGFNQSLKSLMLNYAFRFANRVVFHIGANNIRSQIAIKRTGAKKIDEIEIEYYGEPSKLNFVYCIAKEDWHARV